MTKRQKWVVSKTWVWDGGGVFVCETRVLAGKNVEVVGQRH